VVGAARDLAERGEERNAVRLALACARDDGGEDGGEVRSRSGEVFLRGDRPNLNAGSEKLM
jgi:hypothetical protein